MNNSHLSVGGGHWTGSGALVDLLQEHSQCNVIPGEFTLFSFGQLFQDFQRIIDSSGEGFVVDQDFLRSLKRFKAFNKSEVRYVSSVFRRLFKLIKVYPEFFFIRRAGMNRELGNAYSNSCEQFIDFLESAIDLNQAPSEGETQQLLNTILNRAAEAQSTHTGANNQINVFDQLITPPFTSSASGFLSNTRFINVDRDWRDQYVEVRNIVGFMVRIKRNLGLRPYGRVLLNEDDDRITFFVNLRKELDSLKSQHSSQPNDRVKWLTFEEIVLNTEEVAKDVFDFLDIDYSNWTKGKHFQPERSKKNIGKWKQSEYQREIAMIEERLS